MTRRMVDGTIISSNTPAARRSGNSRVFNNFEIYKAVVTDVIPKTDSRNVYGFGTEYNVLIEGGSREGERLSNVVSLNSFGGINNFCEWVYNKRTTNLTGGKMSATEAAQNFDNSYVIVGFISGHYNSAVILGAYPHPGNLVEKPAVSDGETLVGEFNGLRWKINDDGELIITYFGGKRNPKTPHTPVRSGTAPTEIKIDKDGKVFVTDNKNQKILIDRVSETIRIENPEAFIQLDIPNKTIEVNANKDVKNISGEKQINTVGTDETTTVGGNKQTTVEGTHTETVKDTVTNNYQKDVTETIGQKWQINVSGDVDLNSGGKVTIDASSNVEIQGNGKDIVTTGSYDPFLMAPHVAGYNKIKAGG